MAQPLNGLALLQNMQGQDLAQQAASQNLALAPLRQQAMVMDLAQKQQAFANQQQQQGILSRLAQGGDPAQVGNAMLAVNPTVGARLMGLAQQQRAQLANQQMQQSRLDLARQALASKPSPSLHFVPGSDEAGNQVVSAFDNTGKLVNQTKTNALVPSWQNNANIRERQLATQLDSTIKPHLGTLDAYQRFEQIKQTGDNSQANQFLAQQLSQMAKPGSQRYLSKADLERTLGTTFEGGDWAQRAANYVSQIASGTRTPELDAKLSNLADAMALSSAQRIGQEIQNTRARTPSGVNPDRVVGDKPRIYGRYIITPTGTVLAGKDSADAQAKLNAMLQAAGQ